VADTAFFNIRTLCLPPDADHTKATVSSVAFGTTDNPIANLLSSLMMTLAPKGFTSRAIANYIAMAMDLKGTGKSRLWPNEAVPDGILLGLENGTIDCRTLWA
jgi:hypothetical protein